METDPSAKSRHGVAMMVVLGVVIFFTMMGFMGLEIAMKDSQVSGSLLDIKSKESAAWGGLNLTLGAMQTSPTNTATQLQKFIADSSVTPANKRQWLSFSGGTFSLVASDPGFFPIGTGGDKSGIKVRIVSMNINGTAGVNDGSGIPITLECTGQGRNGQQLKILATYLMLGLDVPVQIAATTGGTPAYALYLNGNLSNSNVGTTVVGNVYIGGSFTGNVAGPQVITGSLKVNGSYTANASLDVSGNAWIGGDVSQKNAAGTMVFRKSLGIGGAFGELATTISVGEYLNVYGPKPAVANWGASAALTVGKQLYFAQSSQSIGGVLTVGTAANPAKAFFRTGFKPGNAAIFYGDFYGAANTTQPYDLTQAVSINGNAGFLDPGAGAGQVKLSGAGKLSVTGNARFDGDFNQSAVAGTAPLLSVGASAEFNGGISAIGLASANAISVGGKTFVQGTATAQVQSNPFSGALTLGDSLLLSGTFSHAFGQKYTAESVNKWKFAVAATNKAWKYYATGNCNTTTSVGATGFATTPSSVGSAGVSGVYPFFGGDEPRVEGSTTSNASACSTTPVSLATHYVPNFATAFKPLSLLDPTGAAMAALDTIGAQASNPPDTLYVDATHSPTVNSKMKTLTAPILTAAGITCPLNGVNDPNFFNKLFTYFGAQGWLVNGYMVIRVNTALSVNLAAGIGFTPFNGKALWVLDDETRGWNAVDAKGIWPASAGPTNIQVIHVINKMKLQNFGVATATRAVGTMYGFVYYGADLSSNGYYTAADMDVGGSTTLGTLMGGMEIAHKLGTSTLVGKLSITSTPAVFTDITSNLPGVLHLANSSGGGGGGSGTPISTKTLVARSSSNSLQFVRVGEFR